MHIAVLILAPHVCVFECVRMCVFVCVCACVCVCVCACGRVSFLSRICDLHLMDIRRICKISNKIFFGQPGRMAHAYLRLLISLNNQGADYNVFPRTVSEYSKKTSVIICYLFQIVILFLSFFFLGGGALK